MIGTLHDPLNGHQNLHFANALYIYLHMSSKNNEENGHMYDLDLLTNSP